MTARLRPTCKFLAFCIAEGLTYQRWRSIDVDVEGNSNVLWNMKKKFK